MSYQLAHQQEVKTLLSKSPTEIRQQAHVFNKFLSVQPPVAMVKINTKSNPKFKYLEIGYIEWLMDLMFLGDWSTKNFQLNVDRALTASLELEYFHPVFQKYITRVGTASIDLQLEKDTLIVKNKAYEKAIGTSKIVAFKNACKSIGVIFGRDLNRDFSGTYENNVNLDDMLG